MSNHKHTIKINEKKLMRGVHYEIRNTHVLVAGYTENDYDLANRSIPEYYYCQLGGNGEVMNTSEMYPTLDNAKQGVKDAISRTITGLYRISAGHWMLRLILSYEGNTNLSYARISKKNFSSKLTIQNSF